jgi:hypothetical protein
VISDNQQGLQVAREFRQQRFILFPGQKSKLEERLSAVGLTKEEISKEVRSRRKAVHKALHALGCSDQDIQWAIHEAENGFPSLDKH